LKRIDELNDRITAFISDQGHRQADDPATAERQLNSRTGIVAEPLHVREFTRPGGSRPSGGC
jgi:hypothetical protein